METIIQVTGDEYISKEAIQNFANSVVEKCDPVFALGLAKMLTASAKDIEDRVKDSVMQQIELTGQNSVEVGGAMFTKANGRTSYDFSDIPEWMDVANQIECLTEERKEIEAKLKGLRLGVEKKSPATVRATFR